MAMITKVEIREGKKPVLCERIMVDHSGAYFTMFVAAEDETMISVEIGPDVAEALRRITEMSARIEKLEAQLYALGVKPT